MSDIPTRLVAATALLMPGQRTEWSAAMAAELAQLSGAGARWRFATSCIGAAVRAPSHPAASMPGHLVTGTFLVGIAGCLATTAYVLRTWPHAASQIPVTTTIQFAVALALYLWFALRPPGALVAHRDAARRGALAGFVLFIMFVAGGELISRLVPNDDDMWLGAVLIPAVVGMFGGVALVNARGEGSFGAGVTAALWAGLVASILTFNGSLLGILLGYNAEGHMSAFIPRKALQPAMDVFMSKHIGDHLASSMLSLRMLPLLALFLGSIGALVGLGVNRMRGRTQRDIIVVA